LVERTSIKDVRQLRNRASDFLIARIGEAFNAPIKRPSDGTGDWILGNGQTERQHNKPDNDANLQAD
jgi:hypothetical protein